MARQQAQRQRQSPIVPPAAQPTTTFESIGAPPINDPLAASTWMHQLLVAAADQVRTDGQMKPAEKLKAILEIATAMRGLVPQSRIRAAEAKVMNADAKREERGLGGPEMKDAAQVGSGSRGPTARRGRPPKRQIR